MAYAEVTRFSDITLTATWVDSDSNPVDLTGYSVVLADVAPALVGRGSISITDAVSGEITIVFEGTDPLPVGVHTYRIVATTSGGETIGSILTGLNVT